MSHRHIAFLYFVFDALVIVFAGLVGAVGYEFAADIKFSDYDPYLGLGFVASIIYGISAREMKLYRFQSLHGPSASNLRVFFAWGATTLFVTLILFVFKMGADFSRGAVVGFFAVSLLFLFLSRLIATQLLLIALAHGTVRGRLGILVGALDELMTVNDNHLLTYGIEVLERFALPVRAREAIGASKLETAVVSSALARAREVAADEIVLVFPWTESPQLDLVCQQLRTTALPIRLLPDRFVRSRGLVQDLRLSLIDIQRSPLTKLEQLAKRLFDVVVSSVLLIMLAPIVLMTALAIKYGSPGPIIFRQRRKGFDGREFVCYKFKTMNVQEDGLVVPQVYAADARVTRLGRLLRQYSIDELPQLFNVLLGQMSLVGPRPHAVAHDNQYRTIIADYAFRHHVKPGITGWAQVNGHRGSTTIEQMKTRVEFDLWYINHWSMLLDLRILAKTIFEVARAHNAR